MTSKPARALPLPPESYRDASGELGYSLEVRSDSKGNVTRVLVAQNPDKQAKFERVMLELAGR